MTSLGEKVLKSAPGIHAPIIPRTSQYNLVFFVFFGPDAVRTLWSSDL